MGDAAVPPDSPGARFTRMLDRTQGALVGFARGLLGNREDARDVAQDVYIEAWRLAQRESPPFAAQSAPAATDRWLYVAAYHRSISLLRRRRVIGWESLDTATTLERAEHNEQATLEDQVADAASMRSALACLDPDDAACLQLAIVLGYPAGEIARVFEITPEAARKRISRALQRLRAAYRDQDAPPVGVPSSTPGIVRERRDS